MKNRKIAGQKNLSAHELTIDNFAGGGGASTGIEIAIGRQVDIAINHNDEALAMHAANHPHTRHFCEDVFDVHPAIITRNQPIGLAWFSPDCKHHSKAKGGKPADKKIRGLAWVTLKWGVWNAPRIIMLENVPEFAEWGPLDEKLRPDKRYKGRTFQAFVDALSIGLSKDHPDIPEVYEALGADFPVERLHQGLGYRVEWRVLRACDYGAPTIRKRLFLIARRDGIPITWPDPTHGAEGSGLLPYRTAAECIDWSIPCKSIFGRKKPLADATLRRIAKGVMRYVVDAAKPFIVPVTHQGADRVHDIGQPFRTITAAHRGELALVTPFISTYYGDKRASDVRGSALDQPLQTQTTENRHALVTAFLAKHYTGVVGSPMADPMHTVTACDHHALVTSHLLKLRNHSTGQDVREPIDTISAGGQHFGEVRAFLIKYYGSTQDGAELDEPMHTVTSRGRFGLVTVQGEEYCIVDIGMRMLQPRELFRAQGFPDTYIIDMEYKGKPMSKTSQVRMCGNSVCPPLATALVKANFRDDEMLIDGAVWNTKTGS